LWFLLFLAQNIGVFGIIFNYSTISTPREKARDTHSQVGKVENKIITKDKIRFINIKHHWSYDELIITLNDGENYSTTQENAKIKVLDNGVVKEYAICKLDYIEIRI